MTKARKLLVEKGIKNYFEVVQSQILVENSNRGEYLIGKKKVRGKIVEQERKVDRIDKYFEKKIWLLERKRKTPTLFKLAMKLDLAKPNLVELTDLDL